LENKGRDRKKNLKPGRPGNEEEKGERFGLLLYFGVGGCERNPRKKRDMKEPEETEKGVGARKRSKKKHHHGDRKRGGGNS